MIQITSQMEIWLAVEAVDFRRGIDGLARVCREVLKTGHYSDPPGEPGSGIRRK